MNTEIELIKTMLSANGVTVYDVRACSKTFNLTVLNGHADICNVLGLYDGYVIFVGHFRHAEKFPGVLLDGTHKIEHSLQIAGKTVSSIEHAYSSEVQTDYSTMLTDVNLSGLDPLAVVESLVRLDGLIFLCK